MSYRKLRFETLEAKALLAGLGGDDGAVAAPLSQESPGECVGDVRTIDESRAAPTNQPGADQSVAAGNWWDNEFQSSFVPLDAYDFETREAYIEHLRSQPPLRLSDPAPNAIPLSLAPQNGFDGFGSFIDPEIPSPVFVNPDFPSSISIKLPNVEVVSQPPAALPVEVPKYDEAHYAGGAVNEERLEAATQMVLHELDPQRFEAPKPEDVPASRFNPLTPDPPESFRQAGEEVWQSFKQNADSMNAITKLQHQVVQSQIDQETSAFWLWYARSTDEGRQDPNVAQRNPLTLSEQHLRAYARGQAMMRFVVGGYW